MTGLSQGGTCTTTMTLKLLDETKTGIKLTITSMNGYWKYGSVGVSNGSYTAGTEGGNTVLYFYPNQLNEAFTISIGYGLSGGVYIQSSNFSTF